MKSKAKKKARNKLEMPKRKVNQETKIYTDTKMKVARGILWAMLGFIFIRGVISCLHQDKTTEINEIISDFKREFYGKQDTAYETLGFAQNFAQEYLTYEIGGAESFKRRISQYVSEDILRLEQIYDFKNTCEPTYVKAYRIEKLNEHQVNVYVKAKIKYTVLEDKEDTVRSIYKTKDVVLKVPIYQDEAGYIVEGIPIYCIDYYMYNNMYSNSGFDGEKTESKEYKEVVTSFLKAYYGSDQSVMDYLVVPDTRIFCIGDSYRLERIEDLQTYKEKDGVVCLVKYLIEDQTNHTSILQSVNLTIVTKDGRQYIKEMNTRTTS